MPSSKRRLPPLLKQRDQQNNLIAVLTGRYPGQAPGQKFTLASLTLPSDLPLSLPSALVEQRPDVLQAEANLHAASAQIGIATANRLPNITLTANAGSTALAIGQMFGPGTGFWNIGAALLAPIFDGGTLLHQQRAARAAYQQTAEQYRGTVLTAFQNVADTLAALEQDAETLKATAAATDAAKASLDLSRLQYKDGYAAYLAVLNADQAYQQARLSLVQAEADRFTDTAALFQALGGGWWHRPELRERRQCPISRCDRRAARAALALLLSRAARRRRDDERNRRRRRQRPADEGAARPYPALYGRSGRLSPAHRGARDGRLRQRSGRHRSCRRSPARSRAYSSRSGSLSQGPAPGVGRSPPMYATADRSLSQGRGRRAPTRGGLQRRTATLPRTTASPRAKRPRRKPTQQAPKPTGVAASSDGSAGR